MVDGAEHRGDAHPAVREAGAAAGAHGAGAAPRAAHRRPPAAALRPQAPQRQQRPDAGVAAAAGRPPHHRAPH